MRHERTQSEIEAMETAQDLRADESDKYPSIEQQEAELLAAGWIRVRRTLWKAPVGGYFLGPHGAWLAVKSRQEKEAGR